MEAKFETVDELGSKRFYLQYRFPPSSVGEVLNIMCSASALYVYYLLVYCLRV